LYSPIEGIDDCRDNKGWNYLRKSLKAHGFKNFIQAIDRYSHNKKKQECLVRALTMGKKLSEVEKD